MLCGMGTTVSLQQTALAVEPGESVSTELRVRNTGEVVDQFSFQPLGDAAPWITVDPPTVRLFPETDALVTVTIAPPRDSTAKPGLATWAVKAIPKEDPTGASVGEGTVDVGTFVELGAELQPMTARARFTGKFELAVDNRGNLAVPVRINGNDSEHALAFDVNPPQLDSQPGSAHFAKIRIKPADKIWRGQPKNHPFQVVVEPQARVTGPVEEGGELPPPDAQPVAPVVVNGNLLQEPILPPWLLKALLALIALLLLLFILWKTLLEPRVESAARDVALEEVAPVSSAVAAIAPEVSEAATQASQAAGAAEEAAGAAEQAAEEAAAGGGGGGGGGGGALGNVFNETTEPSNTRLTVQTPVGSTNSTSADPNPEDTTFALTDVILQNPGGDIGRIRILIAGTPILESALENFRDLDFHFVAPYVVESGQSISIEVDCAADQIVPGDQCDNAVSFAGFTTTVTEVPATSAPAG
jgi:hypothetical protein